MSGRPLSDHSTAMLSIAEEKCMLVCAETDMHFVFKGFRVVQSRNNIPRDEESYHNIRAY
jgi:hypothetical protein